MKKILFLFKFGWFVFMCLILTSIVYAENTIPNTLNIQGRYTKSYGDPVVNTNITVHLQVYKGSSWSSDYTQTVKTDSEGLYNVNIPVDLSAYPKKFRVSIDRAPTSSDEYDFASSPYAFYASTANYAVGASSISVSTTATNGIAWGIRDGIQQWVSINSVSITTATQTTIGGIKLGNNTGLSASIDGDAVLRVTSATAVKIGGVIIGENINIDDSGKISVSTGSKDTFGVFKVGENINVDEGVISISTYTAGDGIVISGTTIAANVDGTNIVIRNGKIDLGSGADLAEVYKSTERLVPGDVVSIDTRKDNSIVKTKVAEDTLVAGVISTEPGVLLNKTEKGYKLALVGKVPTKVCNEGGNIKRGDLLVSASLAGYAKKAGDNPKVGTVIGKALENFDSRRGTILVLVNLQ